MWEGIWNQTHLVVLNFCLERLHHITYLTIRHAQTVGVTMRHAQTVGVTIRHAQTVGHTLIVVQMKPREKNKAEYRPQNAL